MLYDPINFGQYTDPDNNRIWTILDQATLNLNYDGLDIQNSSAISWSARKGKPASHLHDLNVCVRQRRHSVRFAAD